MSDFRPKLPYTTPLIVLLPFYKKVKGVRKKTYKDDGLLIFASLKTYGGTEQTVNDLYSIVDTANVETWYHPDITSDCRVKTESGAIYEIINEPENIDMRNQFLRFKVKRVKGGA